MMCLKDVPPICTVSSVYNYKEMLGLRNSIVSEVLYNLLIR